MYIRDKPILFGYKNWVLCSDDGYPFKVIPYQGKAERREGSVGSTVVKNLLDIVTDDRIHNIYFDNFFTSVPLIEPSVSTDYLGCHHHQIKRWKRMKEDSCQCAILLTFVVYVGLTIKWWLCVLISWQKRQLVNASDTAEYRNVRLMFLSQTWV